MKDVFCPRLGGYSRIDWSHKPDDDHCNACGSLNPDIFMARLEAGDIVLEPTDKDYKVYVHSAVGGATFLDFCNGKKDDAGNWTWDRRDMKDTKFYFQHLRDEQKQRFVELLNDGKINLDYPHHFYRTPFFIKMAKGNG